MSCNCPQTQELQLLDTLAESRTVRVEKLQDHEGQQLVRKSYRFPTGKDQLRGMLRGTLFGKPKVERELFHLDYLQRAQVPAVTAIRACVTRNALGFVTKSHLLTALSPGQRLDHLIANDQMPSTEAWAAIGTSMSRMHQVSFWHRGLAPRNLLIHDQAPFHFWLDPAKSVIHPRGIRQAARADDLLRFWSGLHEVVPQEHKDAFEQAYGQEGVSDPANIWPAIPKGKRAAAERVIRRDATRFGKD
ncbi:MAG: hypothetical protein GY747_05040 [Planctomycetes bacterium]|nr:hypothetical protein [Planctomycetota bacterium]MCP4770077.1 hypothetical protein [Planctomycetota bacterium]MCP4860775.1 hypothetical protein [Planctomycetota bacterium]